jgi:hypothetical protein
VKLSGQGSVLEFVTQKHSGIVLALAGLGLVGCTADYSKVEAGSKGPTSPVESGEMGPYANRPPRGAIDVAKANQEIPPITRPFSNGFEDATMEGSGNIAAQGSYEKNRKDVRNQL